MRLYNSLTRSVDEFAPRDGHVSMYVCGITPYDVTHLGHAFTYLTFDVLRRVLEARGVRVTHVQNVTDVDDDLIRKARELNSTPAEVTELNVRWFEDDMRALGALPPHHNPRVTGVIDTIQEIITRLIKDGHAYEANGDVYFDTSTVPAYGRLSRLTPAEMLAENERQRMRPGPRHPLDFVLWQAMAPGEPFWESPWGPGRPGWHIECSAMSLRFAGHTLDVHGGGRDLIFPHHDSEIAQSESYTGEAPFVRCWMHVGMIRYQGEKMSKSLGNLVLVRDLLRDHSPNAVRLSLLGIHYRESREWTHDLMRAADAQGERLEAALTAASSTRGAPLDPSPFTARFRAALDDDLDTPAAVTALLDLAGAILASDGRQDLATARSALVRDAALLGLRLAPHE